MGGGGSILPWDDWIYHVDSKKHEVQNLHNQAVHLQASINAEVNHFNTVLDQAKQLFSGNAALVIIIKTLKFNDLQLKDFDAQLQALPDPPKGSIPAKFGSFLSEIIGSVYILRAISNLGQLAKSALFSGTEAASEGMGEVALEGMAETGVELGVEAGTEAVAEGALAETGIGIIAAVGLDAIFGAINGAKEAEELNKNIDKLRDAIEKLKKGEAKVKDNFQKLTQKIVQEEGRFKDLVTQLQKIIPDKTFPDLSSIKLDVNSLPKFLADQADAIKYYGLLGQLRVTYLRALQRSPNVTREAIISAVLIKAKADVTHDQLEKLWDILKQYSEGMKNLPN